MNGRVGAVLLLRIAVLAAVLVGLLGMHVLTAGHDAGHGALPAPAAGHASVMHSGSSPAAGANPMDAVDAAVQPGHPAQLVTAAPPMGMGTDTGAACVLFLSFGAALIGLMLLRRRVPGPTPDQGLWLRQMLMSLQRRGPPSSPPHSTLCVIRV